MKENKFPVLGMLAMMLTFSFVLSGCATARVPIVEAPIVEEAPIAEVPSVPKTIKITGFSGGITAQGMEIYLEQTGVAGWPPTASAPEEIDGQTITYTVVNWEGRRNNPKPWTEIGKFFIVIQCRPPRDATKDGSKYVYSVDGTNPALVDIKDEVTTLEWAKFIWLNDFTAG